MRNKALIFLAIILHFTKLSSADVVVVDDSQWTQEQKNMTQSMVIKILSDNNITFDSIHISLPNIDVSNPSNNISSIINKERIELEYANWFAEMQIKIAASKANEEAKVNEIAVSEFTNISIAEIDGKINAISNLAEAKVFLKKMCRYIKARE